MRAILTVGLSIIVASAFSQITLKKKNESCTDKKDGEIEVIVAGTDNHTLEYSWRKDDLHFNGNYHITGLEPGTYQVTVTTKNKVCMGFSSTVIFPGKEPTVELASRLLAVTPDPLECGDRPIFTYKLYALARGGNPPYYYSWGEGGLGNVTGGGGTNENTLTVSGSFINQSVSVIDSLGCVDSEGFKKTGAIRICPRDPNDITGPEGYDDSLRWVSVHRPMEYAIRFENDPIFATANASVVLVTVPVEDDINPFSFRLGTLGFGNKLIEVPDNVSFYQERMDYSQDLGFMLDITAGLDLPNNRFFWLLETIDPLTGQPPADPLAGFLPVNDTLTGSGEGFLLFTCTPKSTTTTGEIVEHQAAIVFDANDPLLTNTWTNTVDAFPPTTNSVSIPDTLLSNIVPFEFTSTDDLGGCGVQYVEVLVSTDNVVFHRSGLLAQNDSILQSLLWGTKYYYKTVGTDYVENRETSFSDSFYIIEQRSIDILVPDQEDYCIGDTLFIEATLVSVPSADFYISVDSGATFLPLDSNVVSWPYVLVLDSNHLHPYLLIQARHDENNVVDTSLLFAVHALPELSTPNPQPGCLGEILFVETSGANEYQWWPDSIIGAPSGRFSNVYVDFSQYAWVRGTDVFGCSAVDSVWLTVFPTSIDTIGQPLCEGDSIFIDGEWIMDEGFYPEVYSDLNACDSTIVKQVFFESPCIWPGGPYVYVHEDATGLNNGTSWLNAFIDLQDAIYVAGRYENVQAIWVAEGTYSPDATRRDTSFVLSDSIKIFGGFLGFESNLGERTANASLVRITGDINIADTHTDNSYHVIHLDTTCVDCVLDGLTIEYGYANEMTGGHNTGAGVKNVGVGWLYNVVFQNNHADELGAAIYSQGIGASLIIENCTFMLNASSLGRDVVNVAGAQMEFRGANSIH